jgi:hypothetical protein
MKNAIRIGLTLSLLGLVSASTARADEWDKKTVLTFSQPVEIPGHVLPAGTYVFKVADSTSDRHVVQVFTADGSQIIATVMAIPNYRLTSTSGTVIRFREMPAGSPEAIRAWFYPGNTAGQEFVYPKRRAAQLAKATNAVVPAVAIDGDDVDALKAAPIVAITPEEKEIPVSAAIQTTPTETVASSETTPQNSSSMAERRLPKTAGTLPLVALLGFGSVVIAFGLMAFGKRSAVSAR